MMYTLPSILPSLYDWSFWVPFFFRLFLAYQLYTEARRLMRGEFPEIIRPNTTAPSPGARKTLAWMMITLSALFFFGVVTQLIGVFTAMMYLVRAVQLSTSASSDYKTKELLYASALISFSLLFLGPGPYAVDLPL
jgi:uncharacterized membrane protein YphA (DoxX/SURF4 family)